MNSSLQAAFKLLAGRGYSEQELAAKLQRRGYTNESIQQTTAYLIERGYLNDAALCKMLYNKYVAKKFGLRAISYKLVQKGFSDKTINEVLADYNADEEWKSALNLLTKKISLIKKADKQKIARYLISRGFTTSTVQKVIRKIYEEGPDTYC